MVGPQTVTILGATGSVGASTLDVLARHPDRYRVHALTGYRRLDVLAEQCRKFRPNRAVVSTAQDADRLAALLGALAPQIDFGPAALAQVAAEADTVMAAIVGAAGLLPVLAAVRAGRRILLANKEALVVGGALFMDEVRKSGSALLPIDSEHNALFQCLPRAGKLGSPADGVDKIILTASGGPFRTTALEALEHVTVAQACAHPNWIMGRKISVDSATMMNKGLEVIEARWLFDISPDRIEVVIHPQSVIHSMVSYIDGSVLAQLGNPDMRTPIAHALGYPERLASGVDPLELARAGALTFEAPDLSRFPCLRLAYAALAAGGDACTILNAANEVAVEKFLAGDIAFTQIAYVVEETLNAVAAPAATDFDGLFALDAQARAYAHAVTGVTQ